MVKRERVKMTIEKKLLIIVSIISSLILIEYKIVGAKEGVVLFIGEVFLIFKIYSLLRIELIN